LNWWVLTQRPKPKSETPWKPIFAIAAGALESASYNLRQESQLKPSQRLPQALPWTEAGQAHSMHAQTPQAHAFERDAFVLQVPTFKGRASVCREENFPG
jgi:hypothetical protein